MSTIRPFKHSTVQFEALPANGGPIISFLCISDKFNNITLLENLLFIHYLLPWLKVILLHKGIVKMDEYYGTF